MPGKILVVEDDPAITGSLVRLLARADYYVASENTAEAAAEHLARDPSFDLALLDVNLPGEDGFACCGRLRTQGWRNPVIMLTGRAASADKVRGLEVGADDYVTKPFEPQELLARIHAHLRRAHEYDAPADASQCLALGPGLSLDMAARDALVAGRPARLTEREYELLALLARHPDTALSKTWLFQEIWGCTPEMGLKALAVYVRRLREKIEPDPEHPRHVQTVRGYGYKIATVGPSS